MFTEHGVFAFHVVQSCQASTFVMTAILMLNALIVRMNAGA
jgi:hypothetical protein